MSSGAPPARALAALLLATGVLAARPASLERASGPARSQAQAGELAQRLADLRAPEGERRLAAQRWLAQHVALEDWPALADAARTGGPELERRLVEVLAVADAGLELALLAAADPALGDLGRAAFFERYARFASDGEAPGRVRPQLELLDDERRPPPLELDPEAGTLGELLDRLARLGAPGALLVLDPALDAEVREREPERQRAEGRWRGDWAALLERLCALHRIELEGHGFDEGGRGPRWVRVCKRGEEGTRAARELALAWCTAVTRGREPERAAAARALGALGWGEALAWLERRSARTGDQAALSGLLLAAGRGAVVPGLASAERVRALLAGADRELAAGAPREAARRWVDALARALARAGSLGSRGERLVEPLLEGWDRLGPRSRWLRLVVLDGWRAREPEARERCLALAAQPGVDPALRLAALRALDPPAPASARPSETDLRAVWRFALARGLERVLVDSLERLGVPPLAGDDDAPAAARLLLLEWSLRAATRGGAPPDPTASAARLRLIADELGGARVREELRAWRRQGLAGALEPVAARLRAQARDADERRRAARFAAAAGALAPGSQRAWLAELRATPPGEAQALLDLALLCDGAVADEALALFVERVRAPLAPEARAEAFALCEDVLEAARAQDRLVVLRAVGEERGMGSWLQRRWERAREALLEPRATLPLESRERSLALDGPG